MAFDPNYPNIIHNTSHRLDQICEDPANKIWRSSGKKE